MPAFTFPDDDEPSLQVNIIYQKRQCFGDAQARACEKPEERGVCVSCLNPAAESDSHPSTASSRNCLSEYK